MQQYYDGDGLRAKKNDNGAQTYYLRSSVLGGQVVAELNGAGTWTRGYVYLGGQLVGIQSNNSVTWMHEDPVNKSKRVTNSAGTVVSTVELDPWGADTNRSNNAAFQPKKFTSYERDGNGSDEAMFRRYNRKYSRFDQPDPSDGSYSLADPQSLNRYAYVQNDPVNFVDPSGLLPCTDAWCGSGGFGGWGGGWNFNDRGHPGQTIVNAAFNSDVRQTYRIWDAGLFDNTGGLRGGELVVFPQNPTSYDDILGPPPPIPALNVGLIATVTIGGTCGVNPVTGQPGFSRHPMGQTGNMRASIGGDGWFGARRPRNNPPRHSGIDIAGVLNTTPVVAFLPGTVTFAGHTPGDGGTIVNMDHGGGITSSYVHLQQGSIPAGVAGNQPASQGQQIGILGNTGNAGRTPPHLHFWIRLNGVLQDPEVFLNQPCPP